MTDFSIFLPSFFVAGWSFPAFVQRQAAGSSLSGASRQLSPTGASHEKEPRSRLRGSFSACQQSPDGTFLTASDAEHFDLIKMLLRPKSLIFQAFLRRVIVLRDGPCPLALSRCSIFGARIIVF